MSVATILIMMSVLVKNPETVHDAKAIAELIAARAGDSHEAAILVELAWRESAFTANAISKDGRDLCAYQLRDAPRSVLKDLSQCTDLAIVRLRTSVKACPSAPLAIYASGSCRSPIGREFNRWRSREIAKIEKTVTAKD